MHNSQFSILNSQFRVESLSTSSWLGVLVLVVLVALALAVSAHRKQYGLYVRNLVNKQGRVMNYDTESTSVWANIFLWFVVVASFAMAIVAAYNAQIATNASLPISLLALFGIMFLLFGIYFGLKWLVVRFMGYVFGAGEKARAFSTDYFVLVALSGLLILPCVLGLIYTVGSIDMAWFVAMAVVGVLFFITLLIKLLQIFYCGFGSLFYIFLYLCTSEILPLLVAVKVAEMW